LKFNLNTLNGIWIELKYIEWNFNWIELNFNSTTFNSTIGLRDNSNSNSNSIKEKWDTNWWRRYGKFIYEYGVGKKKT